MDGRIMMIHIKLTLTRVSGQGHIDRETSQQSFHSCMHVHYFSSVHEVAEILTLRKISHFTFDFIFKVS
jgi:hypothetical protein